MGIRETVDDRDRLDRADCMPHRSFAGDSRLDARLESEFGRLFFSSTISRPEYEAGTKYANIVLLYLLSTDAPEPYGTQYIDGVSDDECLRRKVDLAAARLVLRCAGGTRCIRVVDRVTVYDEPITTCDLGALRVGLRALAGLDR